mgnify:CR=1 FL=1
MKTLSETFSANRYGGESPARTARNARVRELRTQGYTVETHKRDFTDLARDVAYTLLAFEPGNRPMFI